MINTQLACVSHAQGYLHYNISHYYFVTKKILFLSIRTSDFFITESNPILLSFICSYQKSPIDLWDFLVLAREEGSNGLRHLGMPCM